MDQKGTYSSTTSHEKGGFVGKSSQHRQEEGEGGTIKKKKITQRKVTTIEWDPEVQGSKIKPKKKTEEQGGYGQVWTPRDQVGSVQTSPQTSESR